MQVLLGIVVVALALLAWRDHKLYQHRRSEDETHQYGLQGFIFSGLLLLAIIGFIYVASN